MTTELQATIELTPVTSFSETHLKATSLSPIKPHVSTSGGFQMSEKEKTDAQREAVKAV